MFGRTSGHPPFDWHSSGRKSTAVTLWEETVQLFADRSMRGIGQSEQSLTAMLGNAVFDIARGSGKGPSSDDAIKSCRVCLLVWCCWCCCFCSASAADVIALAPARHFQTVALPDRGRLLKCRKEQSLFSCSLSLSSPFLQALLYRRVEEDGRLDLLLTRWRDGGVALWQPKQCGRHKPMQSCTEQDGAGKRK